LNTNNTKNGDEDQEDMTSTIIPPPMNVIKPEHADQVSSNRERERRKKNFSLFLLIIIIS
jgi:hypothetical protein